MAITIDWGTRVISVPKSFLTLISGTNYQLDTNEFRIALADLEDSEAGVVFPPTYNHNTTVTLGGIPYARLIEIINGYTITFEDGAYAVTLTNSNNNILDVVNLNQVSIRSNNSAGLQNQRALEISTYNDVIFVDIVNGAPGVLYPKGTLNDPCDNLVDAKSIADSVGITTIHFLRNTSIDSLDWSGGYTFTGNSPIQEAVAVTAGANVTYCTFQSLTVSGVLSSANIMRECFLSDISVGGFVFNCALGGDVTLLGTLNIIDSYSGIPGTTHPEIDMAGGTVGTLGVRGYNGGLGVLNCTDSGGTASIDITTGSVHLHDTITAGTFVVSGVGVLTDESIGATVVAADGFFNPRKVNELHANEGLEQGNPMTITPTSRTTANGTADLVLSGDGVSSTTVTRP